MQLQVLVHAQCGYVDKILIIFVFYERTSIRTLPLIASGPVQRQDPIFSAALLRASIPIEFIAPLSQQDNTEK